MRRWLRPPGVRVGLTVWYVVAMIVVLAVYASGVFAFVRTSVSGALDARLRGDFTWAAEMWEQQPDGTLTWFDSTDVSEDEDNPWMQVWSAAGELLFRTSAARRVPLQEARDLALAADDRADERIVRVERKEAPFRVLSRRTSIAGNDVVIQVARSELPVQRELTQLAMFLALGLPFGVAAAGLGGYLLARRALAPIDRMTEQARSITAARLSERLPVRRADDELGRLAMVFNDTLERLERSFADMQRFTADVSHQLRTPLTAIRTVGEVGLRETRPPEAYRSIIGSMLEDVDRLTSLVERLLVFSRATSKPASVATETLDLHELAHEVASHLGVLAEENGQTIAVEQIGQARCRGDRVVLRQALINLVDNAIKYSPAGSCIDIRVGARDGRAIVEVSDRGPGIAADRRSRIFDRFSRGVSDPAAGGAGLGLSISKWAVEASRGELMWEGRDGGGSTFRITLPLARAS
jgi:heavy metal sensor kinase